jgi:anti-sigma regulatory factor (Ser/Thr protein kinase)
MMNRADQAARRPRAIAAALSGQPPRAEFPGCGFTVAGGPWAPSHARRALAVHAADALHPTALETLLLLVSEVVTNCVTHGGASDGRPISVNASNERASVRVQVSSAGPDFDHTPRRPKPSASHGRGLFLVDVLAARWGIDHGPPPSVWFEVRHGPQRTGDATPESRRRPVRDMIRRLRL